MKKTYRLIFDKDDYDLHKKLKSVALFKDESMKEFILTAIRERIEKVEKEKKMG